MKSLIGWRKTECQYTLDEEPEKKGMDVPGIQIYRDLRGQLIEIFGCSFMCRRT